MYEEQTCKLRMLLLWRMMCVKNLQEYHSNALTNVKNWDFEILLSWWCRKQSGILLRGPNRKKPDWLAANQSTRFARIPDRKKNNANYFHPQVLTLSLSCVSVQINHKICKNITLSSNNMNSTIRKYSSRAFIWVVTPLGFVGWFRI